MIFGVFEFAQVASEMPIHEEAYNRARAMGFNEKDSVSMADNTIALTFGSGKIEDRSKILSAKSGWPRAMNMFCTFMYAQLGNLYIGEQQFAQGNIRQKIKAVSWIVGTTILAPIIAAIGAQAIGIKKPKDDQSELQFLAEEGISHNLRMYPLINVFSRALAALPTGDRTPFSQQAYFTGALKPFELLLKAGFEQISDDDIPEKLEAWTGASIYWWDMTPFGKTIPIPIQANKLLWNFYDIMSGEMQPEFRDLMTRRPKSERE